MTEITIEKQCGLFDLRALYAVFRGAKDGSYKVTVKRNRKPRTTPQNAWLWGAVYPLLLDGLLDAGWDDIASVEDVHEFFKQMFTKRKAVNYDTGEIVEFPSSTAIMDTVTFNTYVEQLRSYAREYLNMEIPDPDPNWKDNESYSEQPCD